MLTDKTISSTYKDVLSIENSNNGFDTTIKQIKSGNGNGSPIYLDTSRMIVKGIADVTNALVVKDKDDNALFQVDATNDAVKALGNHVNTQFKEFGLFDFSPTQAYHYPMISNNMMFSDSGDDFIADNGFGNGADPATTYDMSSGSDSYSWVPLLWRVQDDITIDSASAFLGTNSGSTDTLNLHIMSYTIDTDNGVTSGDLSAGVVAADSATLAVDRAAVDLLSLTVQSADVDANKVLVATIESDGTDPVGVALTMKYHIR